ncbi:MAG: hypothetical protein WCT40_01865 [Candidatus Magasanikbacteria bacterium]|jgi:hypothetical protein
MKKLFLITIVVVGLGMFWDYSISMAAAGLGQAGANLQSTGAVTKLSSDLSATVLIVLNAILAIVGSLFLILSIYAGYLWMTAAGNAERADKGKTILKEVVIGLVLTLSVLAITNFVGTKFGAQ